MLLFSSLQVTSQYYSGGLERVASFPFDRNDTDINILHSVPVRDILAVDGSMSFLDVMDHDVVAGYIIFVDIA